MGDWGEKFNDKNYHRHGGSIRLDEIEWYTE